MRWISRTPFWGNPAWYRRELADLATWGSQGAAIGGVGQMRHFRKLLVVALSALSLVVLGSATVLANQDHRILQFSSMTPVTGAAIGPAVNDRGLVGGGKAWAITSGSGSVISDGHVMVSVTGLIIPEFGKNPLTQFKAIVSCVTQHHVVVNVSTG